MADGAHSSSARIRSYEWHEPSVLKAFALDSTGLDFIRAMFAGKVPPPPIVSTLAFEGVSASEGEATFAIQPQEIHYNPLGTMLAACSPPSSIPRWAAPSTPR